MSHLPPPHPDLPGLYERREADWRNGAVIYQVLVDRFAPSADLDAKRHHYPAPKRLMRWADEPRQGRYLDSHRLWSQEIEFWGGDLASLAARLDHVQQLGADVLYLNPICLAYTNHKYDALDYKQVSPEYGSREDVKRLAAELHRRGLKLVLDGVFNHMGRQSPLFQQALAAHAAGASAAAAPTTATRTATTTATTTTTGSTAPPLPSAPRDWFVFGPQFPGGARSWWGAANLPELNLENPAVRAHLWGDADSVVRGWLRDGIDGWRLDVAFDIGPTYLQELTDAAHAEKPGSLVVGEIPNYPRDWFPAVDGVMHFGLRRILLGLAAGSFDVVTAGRMIERVIGDAGIEHLLKSWLYLDNHDTERVATAVPDERRRRVAQVLQFTLPGSPNLYYGSEVGMEGGPDPEMRGPMRWDRVDAGHPQLAWTRRLVALHRNERALRVGDFRTLVARELLAFERHTDRAGDAVFVVANPHEREVRETIMVTDSMVMDGSTMVDLLGQVEPTTVHAMLMPVTVPPHTVLVLKHQGRRTDGYSNYKRVR